MVFLRSIFLGMISLLMQAAAFADTHFIPVDPTGLPYHIIVSSVMIDNNCAPDSTEIGIFCDSLCVGASVYTGNCNTTDVVVWEEVPLGDLPGFSEGDAITYRVWIPANDQGMEYIPEVSYQSGDGTFGYGSFTTVTLSVADPTIFADDVSVVTPGDFILEANYPNPFNTKTNIRYVLLNDSHVRIMIYDLLGQLISTLINKDQTSGAKMVQWDGTNHQGYSVSSGMYFYRIESEKQSETRKLMLLN